MRTRRCCASAMVAILLCDLCNVCVSDKKLLHRQERFILFPPASMLQVSIFPSVFGCLFISSVFCALQLSMALVTPVWLEHKIFVNYGFNVNYNLPSSVGEFTRPAYWPGIQGRGLGEKVFDALVNQTQPVIDHKYNQHQRIKRDMSAGEVYTYLRDLLLLFGHNEECLLQMVCELASVPFHFHEGEQMLEDIVHLILTPSLHQSFDTHEEDERIRFERAEESGTNGEDCRLLYSKCDTFPLDRFSELMVID
jgi:DM4/DM12 family